MVALTLAIEVGLAGVVFGAVVAAGSGLGADYVDIEDVPVGVGAGKAASWSWDCGRNGEAHRNTANLVVTPGKAGPVHHLHDYLGNLSVDAGSTLDTLAGSGTSCTNGDLSTYYWPVLRSVGSGDGEHGGAIQVAAGATMTYYGNPAAAVLPMPQLMVGAVGDAYAETNGAGLAAKVWGCDKHPGRRTVKYPICRDGERVQRVYDFPSCWDGRRLDSRNHREHLVFPEPATGACPSGTFAVPRLEIVLSYDLPRGTRFRIDAFDEQRHSPRTDHAFFVNLMPDALMAQVAACLNGPAGSCRRPG